MRPNLLSLLTIGTLSLLAAGCSGTGPNTVNEPKEIKTIEQQMQEGKARAKADAADFKEQAKFDQ